ncbi:MAG: hypothetical protein SYC29_12510 [Planctomycetota bacterium]|nr:hypothetical protein [Planctomycetota bacterium]
MGELLTSGDIARRLGRDAAQVRHILNSRSAIKPRQRAGITRLYDCNALKLVRDELEAIDGREKARQPA